MQISKVLRKAFIMQLNPGSRAEYERRHNPVWAELQEVLKSHGAHNYSIFHDAESNQLFAYVEIEDETRWRQIAETEVCQRWWAYMRELMTTNKDNSPVAVELEEVFHLP